MCWSKSDKMWFRNLLIVFALNHFVNCNCNTNVTTHYLLEENNVDKILFLEFTWNGFLGGADGLVEIITSKNSRGVWERVNLPSEYNHHLADSLAVNLFKGYSISSPLELKLIYEKEQKSNRTSMQITATLNISVEKQSVTWKPQVSCDDSFMAFRRENESETFEKHLEVIRWPNISPEVMKLTSTSKNYFPTVEFNFSVTFNFTANSPRCYVPSAALISDMAEPSSGSKSFSFSISIVRVIATILYCFLHCINL